MVEYLGGSMNRALDLISSMKTRRGDAHSGVMALRRERQENKNKPKGIVRYTVSSRPGGAT